MILRYCVVLTQINDMSHANSSERGQIMILSIIFFSAATITIIVGAVLPIVRQLQVGQNFQHSKQSYYTAEAGSEDAYYRIKNSLPTSLPETLAIGGATSTVKVTTTGFNEEQILSEGNMNNIIRDVAKDLTVTGGFDFTFAVQAGVGGIQFINGSSINGNVYSSGSVVSTNGNPNSYNLIRGGVVSAGASGFVNQIHATSSVYSHKITNATIDGDAYYQTFAGATSSVTVGGIKYPNSPDQPTLDFPIPDSLISQWETDAAAGGTATCSGGSYLILSSVTIGPKKIPCDLTITGNNVIVTLTGALWVTGNILINGSGGSGVQMKVADSVGDKSVAVIADNPSNESSSGEITINGNSNFYGSTGNNDSYVIFISQNNSAEQGGGALAIDVINGAAGNLLTYASHGQIELQNNVNLREVTGYKLLLINNTVVNYAIGLAQTLFTSGAGGSWKIKQWKETSQRP